MVIERPRKTGRLGKGDWTGQGLVLLGKEVSLMEKIKFLSLQEGRL